MDNILLSAIQTCSESSIAFTKFITANDTGTTGSHQAGFHMHMCSWKLFFDIPGEKGHNKDILIRIKWQNNFETDSRFIYYGVGTRNEYRLTRFGKGFPFLKEDNVGDLLIIAKKENKYYEAFVLSKDEDIEEFFSAFGISSTETNRILPKSTELTGGEKLQLLFKQFIEKLTVDFPPTIELSTGARNIFIEAFNLTNDIVISQPSKELIDWNKTEFDLFKAIENDRYGEIIKKTFSSVNQLIKTANTILNRRKSRAGKSLEHHLSKIFNIWDLEYTPQATTEGNKKPDFIFPNIETYFSEPKNSKKLVFLGAKTTCKDRWRQVVGEADRISHKYLFTLQQGISGNQLKEMKSSGVTLVVPKPYLTSFPMEHRVEILTLENFLKYVESTQE